MQTRTILGVDFPVAAGLRARGMGLAFLDREVAGPGLLIPRCRSVHTFGMRFPIDIVFFDRLDVPFSIHRRVGPGRVIGNRRAVAVLESVGPIELNAPGCEQALGGRETGRRY